MPVLFTPLSLRSVTFRNRIFVSPMCQYSCRDGTPTDWHLVHLGSRAVGGAGCVLTEAVAVAPEGRISPEDAGIWSESHARAWERITAFIRDEGAVPGIQLAHAGRKACTASPWQGGKPVPESEGGWRPLGPSPVPFDEGYPTPREMTEDDIRSVIASFGEGARRARSAGFDAVEIHMAHGYLLHQFLSPLTNRRGDAWGGTLENRMRLPLETVRAVRAAWPDPLPLLVRISCTDWVPGGWDIEQSIFLVKELKAAGVDLIDCSSGGTVPHARIPFGPGFQVPFAAAIRKDAGIPTGAVGFITEPAQAEEIVASGSADAVLLARQFLRDPYWPLHAARATGAEIEWPRQYLRAKN